MALSTEMDTQGFSAQSMKDIIQAAVDKVDKGLKAMGENPDEIDINDMFTMQMDMNMLSQTSEMCTSVVSASNQVIGSMARAMK